ncbi:MAG: hypothetical protein XU15_C0011G0095 [candidate division NC10 bacterium CSP1-5]|nr:MAG: hypothetical protein XU15_C0011G0095 [candidate division NC10 bacterium CSP1-5]
MSSDLRPEKVILQFVQEAEEQGRTLAEIAKHTGLFQAQAAVMLQTWENEGYLVRHINTYGAPGKERTVARWYATPKKD